MNTRYTKTVQVTNVSSLTVDSAGRVPAVSPRPYLMYLSETAGKSQKRVSFSLTRMYAYKNGQSKQT